jgi:response regulator of citrate/malate metabolism
MSNELDVFIVDDEPSICDLMTRIVEGFFKWGEIFSFTDIDDAISYCRNRDPGIGIFILDVYLGGKSGFYFLDAIEETFPAAREDTIIITGNASNEVVNRCISSEVHYLLEKPIRPYALQLAIRAIVTKYLKFAKRLMKDPAFAKKCREFK